jgi:hypothetical protein
MLPGLGGGLPGVGGGKLEALTSVLRLLDSGGSRNTWSHDAWEDEPPRRRRTETRGWDDDPAALEDWGKP